MTTIPLMSSEVEVGVDPPTAFTAFTDEMDLWWVRGPINFVDSIGRLPDDDGGGHWIEFRVGNCSLIVLPLDQALPDRVPATHVPWVFVDHLDAHLAAAQAHGATIVEPIHQHGYRSYTAADIEGNRWTFAQARPTMRGG